MAVGVVNQSKSMARVFDLALRASRVDYPILIAGETGVGKEVLATFIHQNSPRHASGNFVPVNCAEISENLVESELFGHVRGAFTGADQEKKGLIEEAHEGTLFLDEISGISQKKQLKLLRVIENKEYRRVGSTETRKSDFRLICAGNEDLRVLANADKFRNDLMYRISAVRIEIPPLRHRIDDIPPLANYFLKELGLPDIRLSVDATETLLCHSWPGNVRELKNVIEYASFILEPGEKTIQAKHLPILNEASGDSFFFDLGSTLREREGYFRRAIVMREMVLCSNRVEEVARVLSTSTDTIYRVMSERTPPH